MAVQFNADACAWVTGMDEVGVAALASRMERHLMSDAGHRPTFDYLAAPKLLENVCVAVVRSAHTARRHPKLSATDTFCRRSTVRHASVLNLARLQCRPG